MMQREQSNAAAMDETIARFDYDAAAELFPTRSRKQRSMSYRRFARAAEAIRFAIEELPAHHLLGAYLEVDELRFGSQGIRQLYDHPRFPMQRALPRVAA